MNIKKLVVTAAAGAVMLSAIVVPAFADSNNGVSVSNRGNIRSIVNTSAKTGNNTVNGSSSREHSSNGVIVTGNASANSDVLNQILTSSSCGCITGEHGGNVTVSNNGDVTSHVTTSASTGRNTVNGEGTIVSGNAGAGAIVTNLVNTTLGN